MVRATNERGASGQFPGSCPWISLSDQGRYRASAATR